MSRNFDSSTITQNASADAVDAGLCYVRDDAPGIRRLRAGQGFRYIDAANRKVRDKGTLNRIRALAIPPAWTDVWICPLANGHLQATGRDARRRKQHRYHARWRKVRDENKYGRMLAFGRDLARIRRRVRRDLALPGLPRNKVLATIIRLLEVSFIRVGNEEYARQNRSFGLTTLEDRHVQVKGSAVHFQFRGKSGVHHAVEVKDGRLARILKRCQDLPGQELFQYLDEQDEPHPIDSADVNSYLREVSGKDYTAKDFRTWAGTILAARALRTFDPFTSKAAAKRNVVRAIDAVARQLGNTRAVCQKCYVHPGLIEAYLSGSLCSKSPDRSTGHRTGLGAEETALLKLLRQ